MPPVVLTNTKVANTILELNEEEKHGYRGRLMYRTGEYLPEEIIRSMIDTIQERADREAEKHHKRHHLYLIEELAPRNQGCQAIRRNPNCV